MPVEVWSDVACPWCCIGRAHLQAALARFAHAAEVDVVWRSFELDPTAPPVRPESLTELLAATYGVGPHEVEAMVEDVRERAASLGLDFRFDTVRSGSTFDAHRVLHLARTLGRQNEVKGRLFRAHFTEGAALGDRDTLGALAVEAGLPADAVADVLAGDRFADAVRADEEQARALQVTGVPFFVVDRRYGVAGAQPPEHLLAALQRAWDERAAAAVTVGR